MMIFFLLLLLLLPSWSLAHAADFAVVQAAIRTTTGTQQMTKSGFGTPKGAILFVSAGLTNETVADHALFGVGFMDGTREVSLSARSKNGIALGTTLAGGRADGDDCLLMADQDATVIIRASCTLVTDGIELNVATAPASAYLVTVVLLGGSGVSDVYASTFTTPTVIDTGTDVTAPGFLPSLVFVSCYGDSLIDDTNDASAYINFGVALASGTQYSVNWFEVNGQATTNVIASAGSLSVARELNAAAGQEVELGSFDSSGFTATTRVEADDTPCGYLAVRLNGLTASLVAIDTPTATGTWVVSGLGITPQFGMLLQNSMSSYDTRISTESAEVFGISAFTSATDEYSVAVTSDDGVTTTTNAESVTANKAVFLRKDEATYMAADFTAFGSGTATFDVTSTAISSARKWAGLFISAAASSRRAAPIIFQ